MTHYKTYAHRRPRTRAETRQDSVPAPADGAALTSCAHAQRAGELVHLTHIPGEAGRTTSWPESVRPEVAAALAARGIAAPWTHQAQAAGLALAGQNVILATRAASGKSAGYLAAALSEVLDGGTVLYIAPTKALAADQLKAVRDLGLPGVRATCYDGDATIAERAWAQSHANYLLTNPGHDPQRAAAEPRPLARLPPPPAGRDHRRVPRLPRRLRLARRPGPAQAPPRRRPPRRAGQPRRAVFILASATIADPAACARLLTGLDAVRGDRRRLAPRAAHVRPLGAAAAAHATPRYGRAGPPPAEAADLLAALVRAEVPALAFIRSRRGAETVALAARDALDGELSRPRSPPTGPATWPTTAAASSQGCATGGSPAWPPPPRSSSASTSPALTRC